MSEIAPEILQRLEKAQAALEQSVVTAGPPVPMELTAAAPAETISAAGSGQVAHVLLDHYFTSSMRRLYAYAGGGWRYRNVAATDEQGVAQVAFSSTRVDAWWDGANTITIMRCWKTF